MNKLVVLIVILVVAGGVWFGFKSMEPSSTSTVVTKTDVVETGVVNEAATMVELKNFAFNPKTLNVKVGTTVTFKNSDLATHTVTADDDSFDSGSLAQGETTTVTFDKLGTYGFHCTPHPNMKVTVVVE